LILVDLRSKGTDGGRAEKVLEACSIACNKNTCPGDKSALRPSGLRLGTPALTSRGLLEKEFQKVAQFIHRGIELTLQIQNDVGAKATLKEFREKLAGDEKHQRAVGALREEVSERTSQGPPLSTGRGKRSLPCFPPLRPITSRASRGRHFPRT